MKLELRRDAILIVPENDQDQAFIEDTLKLHKEGESIPCTRFNDVYCGYSKPENFVLKISKST